LANTRQLLAVEKTNVANLHEKVAKATEDVDNLRREKEHLNE